MTNMESVMHGKPRSDAEKLRAALSSGGAHLMRATVPAEVYSLRGVERVRETAAGGVTMVHAILSPKLLLSPLQRAVGNTYGAYSEAITGSGSSALREYVDRSSTGTGGVSERQVQMARMVSEARAALDLQPAAIYTLGKPRGDGRVGPHRPIHLRDLVDRVCIYAWTLDGVGLDRGWTTERRTPSGRIKVGVPDRQRKAIAEALRIALDAIGDAWQACGYSVPYQMMAVDVR